MSEQNGESALRRRQMTRQLRAILRDERTQVALPVVVAVVYFVIVVLASVGSAPSAIPAALPAALSIVWIRRRTGVSVLLALLEIAVLFAEGVSAISVPSIGAQATVLVVLYAAAASQHEQVRKGGVVLVAFAILGGFLWASSIGYGAWNMHTLVAIGVPIAVLCLVPIGLGWAYRQFVARVVLTDELRTSMDRERDAEREITIEQERNRVAREVHDIVAHSLAVVIMQADGARYAAKEDPATVEPALETIAETARDALTEVRTLLHELRHSQGKRPAPALVDIDSLVDSMRELGLTVDVAAYGHQRALGDSAQLAIYRIVQEALTNALRHGDVAQPVGVDFDWGDDALAVTVTNALGSDGVPQIDGPGHGIPGMRERAVLAGGELNVGVGNRGMFRVRATLPVPSAPVSAASVPAAGVSIGGVPAAAAPIVAVPPARASGSRPRVDESEVPKRPWSVLTQDEVEVGTEIAPDRSADTSATTRA